MRVSSSMLYDLSLRSMNRQQAELLKAQQQVATGRRIASAEDDPVGAARALELKQSQSANAQYATNRNMAIGRLEMMEGTLQSIGNVLQDLKVLAVRAGSAALSDKDRASLAVEVRANYEELLGLANSTDESGFYLFAGYRVISAPYMVYTPTASGVTYSGDDGQRYIQVSDVRQIAVSEAGGDLFERIKNGNGTFVARAAATNAGTATIAADSVLDPAALTRDSYSVVFSRVGATTTYDVINTTTGIPVSTGNAYFSGDGISFAGMQMKITGQPENGDRFDIKPSTNQSVFSTIEQLYELLKKPTTGPGGATPLANGVNAAIQDLNQALDNILSVRAAVGGRLNELDTLQSVGETLAAQFDQTLSALQDVDYASAISRLTQQQFYLEAAQKAFLKLSAQSLFNYF